jgi:hypothetical protein
MVVYPWVDSNLHTQLQVSAQPFPYNSHQCGKSDVAGIVLNTRDVVFRGSAFFGKLFLRQTLLFSEGLHHDPQLECLKAFLLFFAARGTPLTVLTVQMFGKRCQAIIFLFIEMQL